VALAVREGAHPLAIKERLGHASIQTTMDVYGGLFPSLDESIAGRLDGTMRDALAAYPRPGGSPGEEASRGEDAVYQPSQAAYLRKRRVTSLCERGDLNPHALSGTSS
jgi:hypothetical protein